MMFEHPLFLWLTPLLALGLGLLALLARARRLRGAAAWSERLGTQARVYGRYTPWLLGVVALLAGLALAGPRWGLAEQSTESRALNVVIVMDISKSMLAADVAPNRLIHATGMARRVVHDLEGDRLALVVFAARGYLLVPLTLDQSAISLQLDALDPDIASEGGSGVAAALQMASKVLAANTQGGDKAIVLFTDGETFEDHGALASIGKGLRDDAITLVSVPVGDTRGALIPEDLGFHLDANGKEVITTRRDDLIKIISDAAGGVMVPANATDPTGDVRRVLANLTRAAVTDRTTADLVPRAWWFALVASLLLLLHSLTRRTASLVGIVLCLSVAQLSAQRPTSGTRLLTRGDTARALQAFQAEAKKRASSDTAWYNAGTSAVHAGDFAAGIDALRRATLSLDPNLRRQALYNLGTAEVALARKNPKSADSLLKDATVQLQSALALDARDSNVKHNYELARRLKPPPPPAPAPNPQSGRGGSGGDKPPPNRGDKGMSQADAEQVLNAMERAERATRQAQNSRTRRGSPPPGPDW